MKKFRRAMQSKIARVVLSLFLVLHSAVTPFIPLLGTPVYAQESTPVPTETSTPVPTAIAEPTLVPTETVTTPTETPVVQPTVIPTEALTPTPIVTVEPTLETTPTATPEATTTPTAVPTSEVRTTGPPSNTPTSAPNTSTPVPPTTTPTSIPSPTPEPEDTGTLAVAILPNVSAPSLDLSSVNEGSASLVTDKADYAPTDTAIITGNGFVIGASYKLIIASDDAPVVRSEIVVVADDAGSFVYAYQLDGTYRPNYYIEAYDADGKQIVRTTFTDAPPPVSWPTSWSTPSSCSTDGSDESPSQVDFVSDSSHPAVGYASDSNYYYFREQIDHDPSGPGGYDQYAWVVLFQKTAPGYQYMASLNGKDDVVQIWRNTHENGALEFSPLLNDPAEDKMWEGAVSNFARVQNTGGRHYVDWAIPKSTLEGYGITSATTKFFATSTDANNFNKDYLNCYVKKSDLTVTKTNTVSGNATVDTSFSWNLHVANGGEGSAVFGSGDTILTDSLPDDHVAYGTVTKTMSGVTGTVNCSISSYTLSCVSSGSVTMSPGGYINVSIPTTFDTAGMYTNPRSGFRTYCEVDRYDHVDETNENNNSCSNSVTVTQEIKPNPSLSLGCAGKVMLVLDSSDSMSSSDLTTVKARASSIVTALSGTQVKIGVVDYDTVVRSTLAPTTTYTTVTNAINAINHTSSTEYTNWEAAIDTARSYLSTGDVLVMITDGNPTTGVDSTRHDNDGMSDPDNLTDAIMAANDAKTSGIRMMVIGIDSHGTDGGITLDHLKKISGNTVVTAPSGTITASTDVALGANAGSGVGVVLASMAGQSCSSTVTICKKDGSNAPVSNWSVALYSAPALETVNVKPDGVNYPSQNLAAGSYVLRANGTYVYRPGVPTASVSDAGYSKRFPTDPVYGGAYAPWVSVRTFPGSIAGYLGVMVNGNTSTDWGVFNEDHVYGMAYTGTGSPVNLRILDDVYSDNSGQIPVSIYRGELKKTGSDGCAVFTGITRGTYTAEEYGQAGWAPTGAMTQTLVVDQATETVEFVNRLAPTPSPTPVPPSVSIDPTFTHIINNEACAYGSAWADDGLKVVVQNWKPGYRLEARNFTSGGSYGGWFELTEGLWGTGHFNLSGSTNTYTLMHTGVAPVGPAGWNVRVVNATTPFIPPVEATLTYTITNDWTSDACGNVAVCGDGKITTPEVCDNGTANGQYVPPAYGQSVTYCTTKCVPETVTGPYCGDGIKNGEEQCDGTNGVPSGSFCTPTCQAVPVYTGGASCSEGKVAVPLVKGVSISSTQATPVDVSTVAGHEYLFHVTGDYGYGGVPANNVVHRADAGYATSESASTAWGLLRHDIGIESGATYRGVTSMLSDMGTGTMGVVNWGPYASNHAYDFSYIPSGTSKFVISDWWSNWYLGGGNNYQGGMHDNAGSLTLDVYECQAERLSATISKVDDVDPVYRGEQVTYTISGTVSGNTTATGIKVCDTPTSVEGTTFDTTKILTSNPSWYANGEGTYCTSITDKEDGATYSASFVLDVLGTATGTSINNSATVTGHGTLGTTFEATAKDTTLIAGGSIRVCKVVLDPDGNTSNGSVMGEMGFSLHGTFGTATFSTPLSLNEMLYSSETERQDAQCQTFNNLSLGSYSYDPESTPSAGWLMPKYDDEYHGWDKQFEGTSNLSDVRPYQVEGPIGADGQLSITRERPDRTIVLVNQYENPEVGLLIDKENDATGDLLPGGSLGYSLKVHALDGRVLGVKVRDLPPFGFTYRVGSWKAVSNLRGVLSIPEPTYASPGTWSLGDMLQDEVITLTYTADISTDKDPGTYRDLAWAQGTNVLADRVLAAAEPEHLVTDTFTGTQATVVKNTQQTASVNVISEQKRTVTSNGDVLGASTELPATGTPIAALMGSLGLIIFGTFLLFGRKTMKRIVGICMLVISLGCLSTSPVYAIMAPTGEPTPTPSSGLLSVRVSLPKTPFNLNLFRLSFVAMDTEDRAMTVKCYKKSPSDVGYVQFDTDKVLKIGGNSGDCTVDSSVLSGTGTYTFYVTATAGVDTVNSQTVAVDYKTDGPGTPGNYSKETSGCSRKIKFKTADDSGKTVKVEVYRSPDTSFALDNNSRVSIVTIGSNTDGEYTDTPPSCDGKYYYMIRAFDNAGNGSGVIGDSEVHVTTTTTSGGTTTQSTGTTGARIANNAAIPGEGTVLGDEAAEGAILGEATKSAESTPSSSPEPTAKPASIGASGWSWRLIVGAIILIILVWLAVQLQKKSSEK